MMRSLVKRTNGVCIPFALVIILIPHNVFGESREEELIPLFQVQQYLDNFTLVQERNFAALKTWKGSYSFDEVVSFFDEQARRILAGLPAAPAGGAMDTFQTITKGFVDFALDVDRELLYTAYRSEGPSSYWFPALESTLDVETSIHDIRSVVTPEHYLHYEPYTIVGKSIYPNSDGVNSGPAGFRDPAADAAMLEWSNVVDPLKFYYVGQESIPGGLPDGWKLEDVVKMTRANHGEYETYTLRTKWLHGGAEMSKDNLVVHETKFDERVGFNVIEKTVYMPDGNVWLHDTWDYKSVGGIYVISKRTKTIFEPSHDYALRFTRVLELIETEVNSPIHPETFTYKALNIQEGDRYIDNLEQAEYTLRNGKLVKGTGKGIQKRSIDDILFNLGSELSLPPEPLEDAFITADAAQSVKANVSNGAPEEKGGSHLLALVVVSAIVAASGFITLRILKS